VRGAHDFGVDSVFVESGIGHRADFDRHQLRPTWVLAGLH
jgi:ribonucleotide monophosphatase NagD (HAD superfamily)